MPLNEQTSEQVARLASQGLQNPKSLTHEQIQEVCGSVLTQRPDRTATTVLAKWMEEATSARMAELASRGLKWPWSLSADEIAQVCGSALTQAPNHNGLIGPGVAYRGLFGDR